ncbi:TPA: formate--phosphoribosylaminoimidazolecarboxamide ligase [archaeon]|uniref:5-formaminoimidazole-4-carboxamide-1-(beta)-D-ribofuranosyl 5'-monophosphate synthetase n=1 Tax=Candidatus Naiadarchaeum limnaeum TaxID=2756139 RepID=A0A832XJ61_9ARCH|nr:formate--phosphoribosylaminoimidazolecarboxamide ligase [Candidatus Naiadarchaeales archaeon SRR2090153.bin1042]HIK00142.1 formate--phosphoribosylaminoimidazolecarboxamide ligase [Candidatus Naiadarchaeum limnaeum]
MNKPTIATLASHSALQILKGAKEEGFKTLLISNIKRDKFYERFNLADDVLVVDDFKDILDDKAQKTLNEKNSILIPHGSFVEYIGGRELLKLNVPMFGNKKVLEWEADRRKSYQWFRKAGIKIPHDFLKPDEIDRLTLVKLFGAKGGRGYALVQSEKEFNEKVGTFDPEKMQLQEYVLGTRFYPHFFYSPLEKENELIGIDLRYESNADGLPRMPADFYMPPTYVITGNIPIMMRESLLPEVFDLADRLVEKSKELFSPGLIGPYSIELVCTDKLEMYVFEISARIVAGTNVWMPGSPYTYLKYGKPISMGRRIAMEIKRAQKEKRLDEVIS